MRSNTHKPPAPSDEPSSKPQRPRRSEKPRPVPPEATPDEFRASPLSSYWLLTTGYWLLLFSALVLEHRLAHHLVDRRHAAEHGVQARLAQGAHAHLAAGGAELVGR